MRLVAPSAHATRSSPLPPGLPHPVRSAFRVFHPLDGLLLERATRPCFMPERSWSSVPFRAFPSPGAVTSLDALLPSCRSRRPPSIRPRLARTNNSQTRRVEHDSQLAKPIASSCATALQAARPGAASGLSSPVRVRSSAPTVRPETRPMLSWACSSPGHSPSLRRRDVAATASSHELRVCATGAEAPALTHTLLPGVCPERSWPSSPWEARQALMRSAYLVVVLPSLGRALSWLMGSPRGRLTSPRARDPSSDRHPDLPPQGVQSASRP
jgi:hypothetical protein